MTTRPIRARSAQDKLQRSRDLLAAARKLALAHGVKDVTLTKVTQEAGLHPSALRRYFDSTEELLLELAEEAWQSWEDDVLGALGGRRDLPAGTVASVLAESLERNPLFSDLLTHVALSLEDSVDLDRARRYKSRSFQVFDRIAEELVTASADLDLPAARDVLMTTLAAAAYLWQVSHPSQTLATLYEQEPRWGHVAMSFVPTMTRLVEAQIRGARHS
ncbi:TetR family transcriptional regulator [Nonomuraea jiangxiensis]|uniref:DNA-binding transcriptional regulator, AcrR family n=1 Tax=Nonomuraea jiangxiensis TaxID=633440 RepID=A0A1G8JQX5_9ACTN|nr:TetR family transcriptional regulator [Nonomuraea jiangxiensis]SDI33585.1 DNA-binding transcriptional regulator, AcrR family [Nonomuraea jiangxiensis]